MTSTVTAAPASVGQEQLWLLDRLYPSAALYNEGLAFRLTGELDVAALEAALTATVARHVMLHSTLAQYDGEVRVHPQDPRPVRLRPVADLGAEPDAADEFAREAVERPYDLTAEPSVRFALAATGHREHLLVLAYHHAMVDAGSLPALLGDVSYGYATATRGHAD